MKALCIWRSSSRPTPESSWAGRWKAISAYRARGGYLANGPLAQETCPGIVIHHSPTRRAFSTLLCASLRDWNRSASSLLYGPGGFSALDNAISESFVATLKSELVSRVRFPSRQAVKTAIFEYLEAFYNTRRLHSSLGYRSPADFEEDRMREASAA
jgi:transposase InsO family protein